MEEALSRLDDGTYGRCGTCGGVIEDARLNELPMVETCAACGSAALPSQATGPDQAGLEDGRSDPGDWYRGIGFPSQEA